MDNEEMIENIEEVETVEETIESTSRVYIKIDDRNRIIQIEGEYTLSNFADLSECILIEEGEPCDRLNLAQTHYFDKPLFEEHGVPQYKYENEECVERTQAEINADIADIPIVPSQMDIIESQLTYTALMTNTLLGE